MVRWLGLCLPMQGVLGSSPGWGAEIPHALRPKNQNIKWKQYCNKFNKNLKNAPHKGFPGGGGGVQSFSSVWLFAAPWTAACQTSLSFIISQFVQTHVHWVSDAIQPSYSLSSPSPPALSLFWHQGLFQWVSSSQLVAKILELQLQHQSFQWIFRVDFP